MKIGILTFQESNNNGAMLQALALQEITSEIANGSAKIINYHSKFKQQQYKLNFSGNKKVFLNKLLSAFVRRKVRLKAEEFRRKYLNIENKKIIDKKELKELNGRFSVFITGSDQVWNVNNIGTDSTYFLDFVDKSNNKIVSYAPSIALSEIPKKYKGFYYENINRFNYLNLSIREKTGQKIIKDLTGQNATVVVDPTLLLHKDEWIKKFNLQPTSYNNEKYIFVYYISYNPNLIKFVKKLKEKTGYKVIVATRTLRDYKIGFQNVVISPKDFVNYIYSAEYIVTNSFHGTAFSVNFEKKFFAFGNSDKLSKVNSRIEDFLDDVSLSSRYISGDYELDSLSNEVIDYRSSSAILEEMRNKSLNFLYNSLNRDGEI